MFKKYPSKLVFIILSLITLPVFASPAVQTYDQLIHEIRNVRAASEQRIEAAVEAEKVRWAWETGRLINQHVLQYKERADYDKQVIKRLSADLATDESELYKMLKFARTYPNLVTSPNLSWAHYSRLLGIDDPIQRKELEEQSSKENWSEKQLRKEIEKRSPKSPAPSPVSLPEIHPGKTGVYRVVWDLGFGDYLRPSGF
jgi:hypothetical protein